MQPNIIERVWRQDKMVNVDVLNGFTFTDEEEAHRFIISGKNVNTPISISGTITANFKNADGVLVPLTGTIEDGKAVVVLSRECYAVEGPFSLMIFADTVCIYAAIANVINSSGEVIAYPTASIPSVQELIEEVQDVIASIPQDYSALNQSVQDLKSAVTYEENGVNWWRSNDSVFYALADNKRNILRHIRDIEIHTNSIDLNFYIFDAETLNNGDIYLHFSAKRNGVEVATKAVTLPASASVTIVQTVWNNTNSVIDVLYDTNNVAASMKILNTTSYIAVNDRCVIRLDTGLNTAYVPADSKAVGDRFTATETAFAGEIDRVDYKIAEYATKYDWTFFASSENPTGWKTGNYTTDGSANTQAFYLRTLDSNNIIQTIPGAKRFVITAPEGYAVAVCEYDISGTFVKRYGDNDIRNATATRSVGVNVKHGYNYKFTIGRWASGDASSYLTAEFINSIELIVYGKYDYDYIQPYYFPYLDNKVDAINEISNQIDNKSFGFVFVTDFHYLRNAVQSPKLIKYIMQKTGIHTVVFGGDAFQGWKDQSEQNKYTNYVYTLLGGCGETDYYCVTGNHEWEVVGGTNNTQAGVNAITTNRMRNRAIKMDQYGDYYIDDVMSGTRIFFLSCDASGSVPWTSILWLGNQLYDVPDGYNVMVVAHAGVLKDERGNIYQKNTYMNVSKLLGAFDRSNSVDLYDSADVLRGSFDYTLEHTGKSGTSICYLCGHTHEDMSIAKADDANQILLVCTTGDLYKDASGAHYTFVDGQGNTITREVGTIYEQAFDVIQIDPVAKKVYCTRIGAGLDREFSY